MEKDIRELVKNHSDEKVVLSENHTKKFESKLLKELHTKQLNNNRYYISIAASIALLIGLAITFYPSEDSIKIDETSVEEISLGTISPELQTIENYYKNSINFELSQLNLTEENKELFDGYLAKIGELTKEYKILTLELNTKGVNNNTINALIENLKLRLQLLQRLQKQLKNLQTLKLNQHEIQQI